MALSLYIDGSKSAAKSSSSKVPWYVAYSLSCFSRNLCFVCLASGANRPCVSRSKQKRKVAHACLIKYAGSVVVGEQSKMPVDTTSNQTHMKPILNSKQCFNISEPSWIQQSERRNSTEATNTCCSHASAEKYSGSRWLFSLDSLVKSVSFTAVPVPRLPFPFNVSLICTGGPSGMVMCGRHCETLFPLWMHQSVNSISPTTKPETIGGNNVLDSQYVFGCAPRC